MLWLNLIVQFISGTIITAPSLWFSGKTIVGEQNAKLSDALLITMLGIVVKIVLESVFIEGIQQQYPSLTFVDFNRDAYHTIKLLDVDRHEVNAKISQTATADWYRISLAVPKTHETALVTLSMKNMMGCLVGYDKALMHGSPRLHADVRMIDSVEPAKQPEMYKVFHRNLIRLIKYVPPSLSVIDGFVGMEREGPVKGDAVNLGVAVASMDYVAADTIMAKIMGYDPSDIGYLYYANRESLGVGDMSQINVIGENISNIMHAFTPHRETEDALQWKQCEWYP